MKPHRDVHELPIAYLRSILEYNAHDGLRWKVRRRGAVAPGSRAGFVDSWGAWRVRIDSRVYNATRLIYALTYGEWPPSSNVVKRLAARKIRTPWGDMTIPEAARKVGLSDGTMYDRVRSWPRDKWFVPKDSEWRVQ